MKDKIIELHKQGKSYREIASELSVSLGVVQRAIQSGVSPDTASKNDTVGDTVKSRCPLGLDPDTCERHKEKNSIGVIKLRVCDYNLLEQDTPCFKDMPYWDCI